MAKRPPKRKSIGPMGGVLDARITYKSSRVTVRVKVQIAVLSVSLAGTLGGLAWWIFY